MPSAKQGDRGGGWALQMPLPNTRAAPKREQLQSKAGHEKQEPRIRECTYDPASALLMISPYNWANMEGKVLCCWFWPKADYSPPQAMMRLGSRANFSYLVSFLLPGACDETNTPWSGSDFLVDPLLILEQGRKTWDREAKSLGPPTPLPWVFGLCLTTPYTETAAR